MTETNTPPSEQETPPQPPTGAAGTPGPGLRRDHLTDYEQLRRSRTDRKVAGVAGGLGQHLNVDPTVLRVVLVVLCFFGGAGFVLYAAAWLLVPEEGSETSRMGSSGNRTTLLLVAAVLAGLLVLGDSWTGFGVPWPVVILLLVVAALAAGSGSGGRRATTYDEAGSHLPDGGGGGVAGAAGDDGAGAWQPPGQVAGTPPPPPVPARHRGPLLFGVTLALVALALGVLGLVEAAGADLPSAAYPALAVAVVGAMLVVGSVVGRPGGLVLLGLMGVVALAATSTASRYDFDGRSELVAAPTTAAALQERYGVVAGEVSLDLTGIEDLEALDGRTVAVRSEAGRIDVVVPDGLDVRVDAETRVGGEVLVGDRVDNGANARVVHLLDGGDDVPVLSLDADLAVGSITVRQAQEATRS